MASEHKDAESRYGKQNQSIEEIGFKQPDFSSQPAARAGGSLTVWDPMAAIAAMSAAEPPVRSALPGPSRRSEQPGPAGRASARAVIEGTIISR